MRGLSVSNCYYLLIVILTTFLDGLFPYLAIETDFYNFLSSYFVAP